MAQARPADKVKLICGMISARRELFDEAQVALSRRLGPVHVVSEIMPFDLTHYYDGEMGAPLYRRFIAFADMIGPDDLAAIKLRTNLMEADFASRVSGGLISRPINLDPGYITPAKLVLASMKDFSHRIYLGDGVYAEVTLLYHKGGWQATRWTFPDFASGRYDAFLTEARDSLLGANNTNNDNNERLTATNSPQRSQRPQR